MALQNLTVVHPPKKPSVQRKTEYGTNKKNNALERHATMLCLAQMNSIHSSVRVPPAVSFRRAVFWWGPNKDHDASEKRCEERSQSHANALERISSQHGHPNGPWGRMCDVVSDHHRRHKSGAPFQVLDLASGPRGEPGTTIARCLSTALVHCSDVSIQHVDDIATASSPNLTKSILDLSDLSSLGDNTFDAVTCCYGYGMVNNGGLLLQAIREAHRVVRKGGALIIATWESSGLLDLGHHIVEGVKRGGAHDFLDETPFCLPPTTTVAPIALAGDGVFEAILEEAGFNPNHVRTLFGTYPFSLGRRPATQFASGIVLVHTELEALGAFRTGVAGHWDNLAQQVFWTNVGRYTESDLDGRLVVPDNTFKLTVSTKT